MTARFLVGDVFDRLTELKTGSVDLVITSPPFLALRSYLPADHPEKSREIGSEATPAAFIDVMLKVMGELRRVTAAHGSVCIELGDTYAGSGGAGGDYNENGLREGQATFQGSAQKHALGRSATRTGDPGRSLPGRSLTPIPTIGNGWPLPKSRALIPELFRIALAYGINPLTGQPAPGGKWLVRNVVTWCRPNPPVGALGDKWRPATSDVVVAATSPKRYWDDLATRRPWSSDDYDRPNLRGMGEGPKDRGRARNHSDHTTSKSGAPLLDYWEIPLLDGEEPRQMKPRNRQDEPAMKRAEEVSGGNWHNFPNVESTHPAGAPLLDYWEIPPTGYSGSHYAVYPPALVEPLVKAMCPQKVCRTCGEPSRRIVSTEYEPSDNRVANRENPTGGRPRKSFGMGDVNDPVQRIDGANRLRSIPSTLGWSDCGHDNYRPGLILDPFAGSGTTLLVATGHGHDAIGIDLDERNAELALERVGPFLLDVVA